MEYNFVEKNGEKLKIGIYSLYYPNNDPRYRQYQKKIFDKFGYKINQICGFNDGDLYAGHPNYMNHITETEDVDYFLFFDIDAIPLKKDFLDIIISKIYGKNAILGPEQISDHLRNFGTFAAPSCFCISKKFYELLGKPKFNQTGRSDVAQELTHLCREKKYEVILLEFESSKTKNWELKNGIWYGNGSTYEGLIFHNFHGMNDVSIKYFIEQAEQVLSYENK
jgi:hypothetical protein